MILELALFCVFLIIVVAPSDGAVYMCPPLICEPACFMRKFGVSEVTVGCKCFWSMGLKNFWKFGNSRIVQTRFMPFLAGIFGWVVKRIYGVVFGLHFFVLGV